MIYDSDKFINPAQVGGVQQYLFENGSSRGARVMEVNTGAGLRYRVLVDRGLDIDQAFMNEQSLTFLSHRGPTRANKAYDQGLDWLKSFPGGLLTSCGPFNTGAPAQDAGIAWPLHGEHSNTPAEIVSVIQPNPRARQYEMSITGIIRYGAFYGPNLELRRVIRSRLGEPVIEVEDVFTNVGNHPVEHAWLLHVNFGYPLLDEGTEFVCRIQGHTPRPDPSSQAYFKNLDDGRFFPAPSDEQTGDGHVFRYVQAQSEPDGQVRCGLWNAKQGWGIVLTYMAEQFPRLGQWMHWGKHEYVAAWEPMTAGVEGRDKDRSRGWLRVIAPGEQQSYCYSIRVVNQRNQIL